MDETIQTYISKIWQCRFTEDYEEANKLFKEAAALHVARDELNRGELLRVHSQLKRDQGKREEALNILKEATDLLMDRVPPLRQAHLIRHLADIETELKSYETARLNYRHSIQIYREHADQHSLDFANALRGFAYFNEMTNNHLEAIPLWQHAGTIYAALNIEEGVQECNSYIQKKE